MNDYDIDAALSETQLAVGERETPVQFTTGVAGTGKTYNAVRAVRDDPSHGVLSSTTGISAVNLGAITINSLLRYSTVEVMHDHFINGSLVRVLHALARQYRWLYIDEISMFSADALDILYRAMAEVNRFADVETPMGIHIVGDFCQLSPVKARWAFEAGCWEQFAGATERLTKVWRQDGGKFLDALNLMRRGEGGAAAELLSAAGARFETALDTEFEGTTILPRNDQVGRYNALALNRVPGKPFKVTSRRWGQQRSEWGQSARTREWGIPPEVELKIGAYVMVLANAPDFSYVNGDCGWITSHSISPAGCEDEYPNSIGIKLVRTGKEIYIHPLVRAVEHSERPDGLPFERVSPANDDGGWFPRPHYRGKARRWVTGQIEYFPVRLAYASTVHKTQSLTLDRVQVDIRNHFFASPAMEYVALSRCRTLGGLRIVGQQETFAKHCTFDERIRQWL